MLPRFLSIFVKSFDSLSQRLPFTIRSMLAKLEELKVQLLLPQLLQLALAFKSHTSIVITRMRYLLLVQILFQRELDQLACYQTKL